MHIMLLQNTIVTLQITDFLFQAFKYHKNFFAGHLFNLLFRMNAVSSSFECKLFSASDHLQSRHLGARCLDANFCSQ